MRQRDLDVVHAPQDDSRPPSRPSSLEAPKTDGSHRNPIQRPPGVAMNSHERVPFPSVCGRFRLGQFLDILTAQFERRVSEARVASCEGSWR